MTHHLGPESLNLGKRRWVDGIHVTDHDVDGEPE